MVGGWNADTLLATGWNDSLAGVLMKAKQTGLIPAIRPQLDQLETAGCYLRPEVRAQVLELTGEAP
jgi:predicted nucleic acid-binding protein